MKWVIGMLVIIVVLLIGYGAVGIFSNGKLGLNIEEYDPYTLYNGGITTALPITTTGALTSGALSATTGSFSGTLAATGNATFSGDLAVTGSIIGDVETSAIAATNIYSTTTLTAADSGKTFLISASGTTITLPTVYATGTIITFIVNGAIDSASSTITTAEGDNLEGSVIVAGAVVDCNAADSLVIDNSLENIGDFFTLVSTGTYWVPLQSGALTTLALTCSG